LSCSGLLKGLTCSFSPTSITPGSGAVNSVLTVYAENFVSTNGRERNYPLLANWLLSFGLFGFTLVGRIQRKRIVAILGACAVAMMIVGSTSCGGNTAGSAVNTSNTTNYIITVNGSASSIQLSTTVTVTVK
jgi:hypothetical protein